MKQTRTTLKELTAAYRAVLRHGILCNAIALGLIAATPAIAGDPYISGNAFVFGDLVVTDNHGIVIDDMAVGGRRLAGDVANKYMTFSKMEPKLMLFSSLISLS